MLTREMLDTQRTLNEPAVEVIWRLRAENVISVEDYEVLRDALYKLAELEADINKQGYHMTDGTYICPSYDEGDSEEEDPKGTRIGNWNFIINPPWEWIREGRLKHFKVVPLEENK